MSVVQRNCIAPFLRSLPSGTRLDYGSRKFLAHIHDPPGGSGFARHRNAHRENVALRLGPTPVHLMPFPAECEAAWKDMKLAIESGTGAKVSFTRFDESVPQYPNLAGFVRIDGVDKVAPSELRAELNGATARCYAGASTKIP